MFVYSCVVLILINLFFAGVMVHHVKKVVGVEDLFVKIVDQI